VVDIPIRDVNRDAIEELCSKFGKVNSVELKRVGRDEKARFKAYVTYLQSGDADYAVYSLTGYSFKDAILRSFPAPLSEDDIQKRKGDKVRRDRDRISGGDMSEKKKRAKEKPKKGSLRFLAAPNSATDISTLPNTRRQTNNSGNTGNTGSPKRNNQHNGNSNGNNNGNSNGNSNGNGNGDYHDNNNNNKRRMNNKNTNNAGRKGKNQPRYQKVNNNNGNVKNTHTNNEEEVATPPTQKKNFGNKYEVIVRNKDTEEIVNVFYLSQEDLDNHFPNIRTFRKESN